MKTENETPPAAQFPALACSLLLIAFVAAESRCILLPVVLRVLQAHMQEQKDLVMCARILTSMLSLIKKEENGTAVSKAVWLTSPLMESSFSHDL